VATREDEVFGRLAIQKGLLTTGQVQECRHQQRRLELVGETSSLSDIAVQRGYVTAQQVEELTRGEERKPDQESKMTIGNYEVISMLGKGGMGAVYKARHVLLDKVVALKVLPATLARNRTYVQRFHREARIAAKIDHQNVVRVTDVGEENGVHYLCMDFVDGETIADVIQREHEMDEVRALDIVLQVAHALQVAEEHNIVHRDIKPANIMITARGNAKLTDLGIAKQETSTDVTLTSAGAAMGTPSYMAPEQARGAHDVDKRADFYALGATLFHMVTGKLPYEGESANAIIIKVATEPMPDPRSVNPNLGEATTTLICKMMAKDPDQRQKNAAELVADCEGTKAILTGAAAPGPAASGGTIATGTDLSQPLLPGIPLGAQPAVEGKRKSPVLYILAVLVGLFVLAGVAFAIMKSGREPDKPGPSGPSTPEPKPPVPPDPKTLKKNYDYSTAAAKGLMAGAAAGNLSLWKEALNQWQIAKECGSKINAPADAIAEIDAKIQECQAKSAEGAVRERSFQEHVAAARKWENTARFKWEADEILACWVAARASYVEARKYTDNLTEIDAHIARVEGEIENIRAEGEVEKKKKAFTKSMKSGEDALRNNQWDQAIKFFKEAQAHAAELKEPPDGLERLDASIKTAQESQEKFGQYTALIQEGDAEAGQGRLESLENAQEKYQGAARLAAELGLDSQEVNQKKQSVEALIEPLVKRTAEEKRQAALLKRFNDEYLAAIAKSKPGTWAEAAAKFAEVVKIGQALTTKPDILKTEIPGLIQEAEAGQKHDQEQQQRQTDYEAAFKQTRALMNHGNWEDALKRLMVAKQHAAKLDKQPETADQMDGLAREIHAQIKILDNQKQALAHYTGAYLKAMTYRSKKKWDLAVKSFEQAQAHAAELPADKRPDTYAGIDAQIKDTRQKWQADGVAQERRRLYKDCMDKGNQARAEGRFGEAIKHYENAKEHTDLPQEPDKAIAVVKEVIRVQEAARLIQQARDTARKAIDGEGEVAQVLAALSEAARSARTEAEKADVSALRREQFEAYVKKGEETRTKAAAAQARDDVESARQLLSAARAAYDTAGKFAGDDAAAADRVAQCVAAVEKELAGLVRIPFEKAAARAAELEQKKKYDEAIQAWAEAERIGKDIAGVLGGEYEKIAAHVHACKEGIREAEHQAAVNAFGTDFTEVKNLEDRGDFQKAIQGYERLRESGARIDPPPPDYVRIKDRIAACRLGVYNAAYDAAGKAQQARNWQAARAKWQETKAAAERLDPKPDTCAKIDGFLRACDTGRFMDQCASAKQLEAEAALLAKPGEHRARIEKWKQAMQAWEAAQESAKALEPQPAILAEIPGRIEALNVQFQTPIGMVFIPAGKYMRGDNDGPEDGQPAHECALDGFFIDVHEVTNAQYQEFVKTAGYHRPENEDKGLTLWGKWGDPMYVPPEIMNHPVVNVSWLDAVAYCKWRSEKEGLPKGTYRLPTEAEWEKAARGADQRVYPWGKEAPDASRARFGMTKWAGKRSLAPVGSLPNGSSWCGCRDMAGNVAEWCHDVYDREYYLDAEEENPQGPNAGGQHVIRGGSWGDGPEMLRCARRGKQLSRVRSVKIGFRCARSLVRK